MKPMLVATSPDKIAMALLSPRWPAGVVANGIATYTQNLVPSLAREGVDVFVMSQAVEESCQDDFVVRLPATVASARRRDPIRKLMMRIAPQWCLKRRVSRSILEGLRSLRRRAKVRLLEMEESLGIASFVTPAAGIPVVVRMHGPWFLVGPLVGATDDRRFASRNRAECLALAGAAAVSAPSQDVLNRARSFFGLELKNAVVIPNPSAIYHEVDRWCQAESVVSSEILFVGRFDRCKGADVLIDAFAKVARQFSDTKLVFVGPDNGLTDATGRKWQIEDYATERLQGAGVRERLQWLGKRSAKEIEELRRRARVTVICSRYETFSMVALEAMSMGCPVVATAVGGLTEIIQDGQNGLLCRAGDSDDLARKISMLLQNTALAARLGRQAAIDCRQRYHPTVVARQMAEFYREVIAKWEREHSGNTIYRSDLSRGNLAERTMAPSATRIID